MSWIEWTDNTFRGLDLTQLKVDQAYFNISNQNSTKYYLYSLSEECVKCPFRLLKAIRPENDTVVKLNTAKGFELRLFKKDHGPFVDPKVVNDDLYLSEKPDFGEFGVYDLIIKKSGAAVFNTAKEPVNTFSSILMVSLLLVCFYWICKFINIFLKSRAANQQEATETIQESSSDNELDASKSRKRLKSLDIFRGVAIVLMIFVNSGGGHYWWIEHAVWNGLHFADLVFPWFLFIMGVCIPLSIKSQVNRQVPINSIVNKIIKRSITLFFLGLCLNTQYGASFQNIRIFGVLQRFGVAYLVVSLIHVAFVSHAVNAAETRIQQLFYDIRMIWKQWVIMLSFIGVYLIFVLGINAPNCDRGYLGPGGIHDYMKHVNCTGGIAGYIDRIILGESHLYQRAKIRTVYNALAFDPEGLFGCIMTCVQVFLGVQCGVTLIVYPTAKERLRRWILWGVALLTLTAVLTLFSVNDGLIPINKNLWSLSFVTVTSSLAFLLLSLIYYLVDVKNIGDDFWTIFLYPGMNAIALYIGHSVFHSMWPFHWSLEHMNTHFVLLLENVYTVIVWILISHWMYHKKIFYNV